MCDIISYDKYLAWYKTWKRVPYIYLTCLKKNQTKAKQKLLLKIDHSLKFCI